jgi:hypothetical protein
MPQALLLASVTMMLMFLGIFMEILTITPTYSTFGYQTFKENGKTVSCTLENFNEDNCVMSNVSSLFNKYFIYRLSLSVPIFSGIVYLQNWVFILVFCAYCYQAFKNDPTSEFEDEIEDEEDSNLLV